MRLDLLAVLAAVGLAAAPAGAEELAPLAPPSPAKPANAGPEPSLAPLVPGAPREATKLAPLTSPPAKPKPRPKPSKPAPEKPKPRPAVEKPWKPGRPAVAHRVNADKLLVRGVPPETLRPGQSATLSFKVLDADGQPLACEIALLVNVGMITEPVETAPGQFTATYAAPSRGLDTVAVVRADVKNAAHPVFAEMRISLGPAETIAASGASNRGLKPARVTFTDAAHPGETTTVRFRIEDADGNDFATDGVKLLSDGGKFVNVRREKGAYVADFVPNDEQGLGEVTVYAEAGGERIAGESTLTVSARAAGGKEVGFGIGIYAGGTYNLGKISAAQVELNPELQLLHHLRLGILAGFSPARGSQVPSTTSQSLTADFSFSIVPILARAAYEHPIGPLNVFAGGMLGVALVSGRAKPSGQDVHFSEHPLDLALFGGLGLPVGPGMIVAELRASRLPLDHTGSTFSVKGDLGGFSGAAGYKLEF